MSDTNAALALQVLSGYHEVQEKIGELLSAKYRSLGDFGAWLTKRTARLTDDERRSAFLAIASDVGLADRVKHVPNVMGDAKKVRDALAHSFALRPGDEGIRGFKNGNLFRYSAAELELVGWRLYWVMEQVLHTAEVAGLSPVTPFDILRRSGVRLKDAPPSPKAPSGPLEDPCRIPRWDLRLAQMKEREAKRQQSSAQLDR